MKAEIISIGTEILLGEITDTNASYLAGQLPSLGIDLFWVSQVGDNRGRLLEVLKRAWERSDLILTTGGLGPTADDITRDAIADLLGETQTTAPELEAALRKRFGGMGMNMPLSNLKQAQLIPSAEAIPNDNGTAPGWWVEKDGRMLAAMPGPPREMHPMWETLVKPRLTGKAGTVLSTRTLKIFGLSEAAVGETVAPLLAASNPTLGIYARADGIHLRLAAKAADVAAADSMLDIGEREIRSLLPDNIWGSDEETLEAVCSRLLLERGLTIAVMEDYSGGLLSASMTELPDSRLFFKGGLVSNSPEAMAAFGVNQETVDSHGAVSPETALAMAEAARDFLKADIGIGSTGIIESDDRPVGTTYIGIAGKNESRLAGRPRRKQHVSTTAMFELRKMLLESPDTSG